MGTIEVVVKGSGGAGRVDELTGRVHQLSEQRKRQLAECSLCSSCQAWS